MTINQIRPRRETVRAGVLAAAEDAFLANGYERTTVSEIAAAAGFTKGAVYSNFGGKPELLRPSVQRTSTRSPTRSARRSPSQTSPKPPLRLTVRVLPTLCVLLIRGRAPDAGHAPDAGRRAAHALTAQITGSSSWPALWTEFRTLAGHDRAVRDAYAELRIQLCAGVERRLRTHASALALPPDADHAVAATLLLTLAHGLALEHAAAPEAVPADLIEESLTQLIGGLR